MTIAFVVMLQHMIHISVWVAAGSQIRGFATIGHANYADHGIDIVCAGVSALTQSTVLGLREVAGVEPSVKMNQGLLLVRVPDTQDSHAFAAQVLLRSMVKSLMLLANQYPAHVRLRYVIERQHVIAPQSTQKKIRKRSPSKPKMS